jgi:predicted GIY-YIG superfamily endonuclease
VAFTYILRCADGALYVGHTDDLASRERAHNEGDGAKYTAIRRPVCIVYAEEHASLQQAIARERQLKCWTSIKKEALVRSDGATLKAASSRRDSGGTAVFTWRDLLQQQAASKR